MEIDDALKPDRKVGIGLAWTGRVVANPDRIAAGRQMSGDLVASIHAIGRIVVFSAVRRRGGEARRIGTASILVPVGPEWETRRIVRTVDVDICVWISRTGAG